MGNITSRSEFICGFFHLTTINLYQYIYRERLSFWICLYMCVPLVNRVKIQDCSRPLWTKIFIFSGSAIKRSTLYHRNDLRY